MKFTHTVIAVAVLLVASQANACGFRLNDGKLLKCGMTRIEVMAVAGEPLAKDIETTAVDSGEPVKGETIETWSYRLQGDIGGEYLVSVTLSAGKVSAIYRKQQGRI
ncbi:hypothetical protein [Rheinheimera maricola]|uniref:DUF2845 domain-containing protein n=1 Tax=Rheinheimera maricola TaxID=2793282 RepID=A0ABS7X579_9GAMM|nr:hypothetical protein [Rheinheimera maricola]MBZ9610684.1 hypothetical protein [Rheinheimera maricola]